MQVEMKLHDQGYQGIFVQDSGGAGVVSIMSGFTVELSQSGAEAQPHIRFLPVAHRVEQKAGSKKETANIGTHINIASRLSRIPIGPPVDAKRKVYREGAFRIHE